MSKMAMGLPQKRKYQEKTYFYDGDWKTARELSEMVNMDKKKFLRELHKQGHNLKRLMDLKLGKINFD